MTKQIIEINGNDYDINEIDSWVEIVEIAPINFNRVYHYAGDFLSFVSVPIAVQTVNIAKRSLFEARNSLDLMITTLVQLLYDHEILKRPEDAVLYAWLKDDLGRFLQDMDTKEKENLVIFDNINATISKVGIARISGYAKNMNNCYQAIFESILKSIKEYYTFEETDVLKRSPRVFLYIFFNVLQVTISVLGSMTRNSQAQHGKKGYVANFPTTMSWQKTLTDEGLKSIRDDYKNQTGKELVIPDEFLNKDDETFGGVMEDEPDN